MLKPIKVRILEIMNNNCEKWNYEIVSQICKEYNINSSIGRDYINFDLIELSTNCFICDIDQIIDVEGIYKKNFLLHKYIITKEGKDKLLNFI